MYPTSTKFNDAIKRSHQMVSRAEILNPDGGVEKVLPIHDGMVTVDDGNSNDRICNVMLGDDGTLTPSGATDLLHPLSNNSLKLYRGIRFDDGTEELLSLGIFRMDTTGASDGGEGVTVQVWATDYSKRVQRARLLAPYVIAAGTRYDVAIKDLISSRVTGLQFNFPYIDMVTPQLVLGASGDQAGGDPWKYAKEMATSVGHRLFFDANGVCTLSPILDPATTKEVWTYSEGVDAMIMSVQRYLKTEETFNHVIASGENTSLANPVRAEAMDTNPNSPTYIGDPPGNSPFGDIPYFLRSEYIRTTAQAQAAADAKLQQLLGSVEAINTVNVVHPAHEAGDIVKIQRARIKVDARYVVDRLVIPLSAEQPLNMVARERRV